MKKYNSLAEYVICNFNNEIKSSLIRFFKENCLYASREEYENPEKFNFSIHLSVQDQKAFYFKAPNDLIDFDLVLNLVIETDELVGEEIETKIFEDVYTLTIEAELNNGIHGFIVKNVFYGSHARTFDFDKSLSEFLTPYIKSSSYEKYGRDFLDKFFAEALGDNPIKVNPIKIIDRMGLVVYFAHLGDGIDGKILFASEDVEAYNVASKKIVKTKLGSGTILINTSIIKKGFGCFNNTLIHECLHWWLHKKYFELQMLLNPDDPRSRSYIDEMEMPDNKKFVNKYFMELQARSISPIVLMPEKSARNYYEKILKQLENRKSYHSKNKTFLYALYKFTDYFGVSTSCARIRLENLGYTEVSFSSKIGKELKIKPFKSSVRLETGQTYILEFSEAVKAFYKDPRLKLALSTGKILYVDGLFVINDEKYVKFYKKAKPRLTELALSDVSKCCLLFDTKKESYSIEFDPNTFNFITFCSGGSKTTYKNNPTVSKCARNDDLLDLKRSSLHARDEIEEARTFVSKMNQYDTFSKKLDCLLGKECMCFRSNRGIGNRCHIDGKTIGSYRDGTSRPDEKKLLAICAGLELHPLLSSHLLKANRMEMYGISEEPYPFYCFLLNTCYHRGLDVWNALLQEAYPEHYEYCI